MRFVYALLAIWLWCLFGIIITNANIMVSVDAQVISTAIIAAGALAGGKE